MYEISVKSTFSAAHHLAGYPGQCSNLHGHNWDVEVFIRGERLNEIGLLVDFRIVKESLKSVISELDHAELNKIGAFKGVNPSSENIASFLFDRLSSSLDCDDYKVYRVAVGETPGSMASFSRS